MCLILFAYRAHPAYKLVVAANRDEFYDRPTAPLHYWEDHPGVLAGRDLLKMGTWLGVSRTGRFAALTNYRNPKENTEGKRSRGELVADYLTDQTSPEQYMQAAASKRHFYPGYNLLAGDSKELYYYSNIEDRVRRLEPGIYGISNHLLNTDWPKVRQGREGLARILGEEREGLTDRLFSFLQTADPAPDHLLPSTGVSLEWERRLSPMFIRSEAYGTRSSAVVLVTEENMMIRELVYTKEGINERKFDIALQNR
ncbi:NRDE family protein [Paenibacillus filicis]|uniref:NRDE family protein n=1 Tax=Paenibacillus gyeongsangnamensis TaxID=3388067 RepID=A0ABT4Q4H9_9BACL|nr:NRDE family protein [Paenibacillus filicis]MCZ8511781.1 NRDE family protein [Paenibacillus filicis]